MESVCAGNRTGGSNPLASAILSAILAFFVVKWGYGKVWKFFKEIAGGWGFAKYGVGRFGGNGADAEI